MELSQEDEIISTQAAEKCVNEIVKAILILDYTKKPFKQNDIAKFLSKTPNRNSWENLLKKAKEKLSDLGYKLVDCKGSKTFILTSSLLPLPSMFKEAAVNEVANRTLLFLVLTYIFMKEDTATSVDILNHLQQLNIYSEEKPIHKYFGDVKKKILNEFVSELYLEKITSKESDIIEIKWGDRAHAEVSKRSILEFVCKIGYDGSIEPKHLASQYQKVLEDEESINTAQATPEEAMIIN